MNDRQLVPAASRWAAIIGYSPCGARRQPGIRLGHRARSGHSEHTSTAALSRSRCRRSAADHGWPPAGQLVVQLLPTYAGRARGRDGPRP